MKIIYDAMGGDNAPLEIVKGAVLAKNELGIDPVLVGKEEVIKEILKKENEDEKDFLILNANTVIENDEEPVIALRKKKDSSIVVGLNFLRENKADGLISAGSTGALLAGGIFIVKRIPGVERAPIATLIPTKNDSMLLVDSGANVDTTPEMLNSFATLASIYLEKVVGRENPTVGLLNIGKEKGKGNNLYKSAYELLEKNEFINFTGNYEARELPFGVVDIIVADGFDGNIFLKTYEGTGLMIKDMIKEKISSIDDPVMSAAAKKFLKKSSGGFSDKFSGDAFGGAPLLGLEKPIFKAHGVSDAKLMLGASKQIKQFIDEKVIETIKNNI